MALIFFVPFLPEIRKRQHHRRFGQANVGFNGQGGLQGPLLDAQLAAGDHPAQAVVDIPAQGTI